jgi:hypothetical protein
MEWIDPKEDVWKWIDTLFHKTRASNHHYLGKLAISNIFKLTRNNEEKSFIDFANKIASNKCDLVIPDNYKSLWKDRPQDNSDYEKLRKHANILPLWHGSATPNFHKILSSALKFRRPGFTVSGSMFDAEGALYFANSSSKSCGYTSISNSAWSKGNDKKAYLFLSDVSLGNSTVAQSAYQYTLNKIRPNMSVWAKAGKSLYNDEYMVYTENQNWLRYVIEFESIR